MKLAVLFSLLLINSSATVLCDEAGKSLNDFFADEVWPKIGAKKCLKCHKPGGDAEESEFILRDPSRDSSDGRGESLKHNQAAFEKIAKLREDDEWLVLLKVIDEIDHEGGDVLEPGSTRLRVLERFVRSVNGEKMSSAVSVAGYDPEPFWDGISMLDERKLLRRLTLSLTGRLPNKAELKSIESGGLKALDPILDELMNEDAFYERLAEAFNDILLIRGYDGVAEGVFSYTHFFKTKGWYKKHDPGGQDYSDPKKQAYHQLTQNYYEALRREPLELITHIVRNERPFTEIVTADYIMVSPYTSRGYGIYEQLQDKFKDSDDPFEFIPASLKALTNDQNGKTVQESATGFYPHAGLLSSFQYLKRYPTTETNRNRLRVRMYFEHFLGIDLMALAPRVNDAAAITAKYEVPTMEASDCVVCHKIMDPIAGLFQDYYVLDGKGIYGPRKEGWYEDMFDTGFENEDLPPQERWRSLQWLGERTAKDPRFAVAMVKHVFYILTGRKPLLPPEDVDDPLFAAKQRVYRIQRDEIEGIAKRFSEAGFNLKDVFKELAVSRFYRADGLSTVAENPHREAELADIGLVRMLSPEQLERKLAAVFGKKWGRLTDREAKLKILYGGIDSKEVTERLADPSGAMGAIQRMMANDMACKNVAPDFSLPPEKRRLFPGIEPDVVPGENVESDEQIAQAIVHLHELLLGRFDTIEDPEVKRTYDLFAGIVTEAKSQEGLSKVESYSCQTLRDETPRDPDPHYTIRAWRAVVTYLLRQHEFLYE